jgi:hypothetical protein
MKINEDVAEFIGFLIGDGCLSKYWSNFDSRWKYVIAFTGHWNNDYHYYENYLRRISFTEFGIKGYLYHRKDDNTVRFFIANKTLFMWLHSLGLPVGLKNKIKISKEISKNLLLSTACVRGIFNSDGTVYRRYAKVYKKHPRHYKNYAVIQFKLKNKNIVKFVKETLEKSGFAVNRITKDKEAWVCRITTQKYVDKFFLEIANNHK